MLVIEELRTGALMNVALEAAASGQLVIGGFTAHTATGAIDRIIDLYAPEHRRQVQMALADTLRGVVAQVLLRKIGGGRLPAREVLLNTPAVSSVIAEGKTSQLPMAIEGGRRHGMMPLNDALVGLVQSGVGRRRAKPTATSPDRAGFLARSTARASTRRSSSGSPTDTQRRRTRSQASASIVAHRSTNGSSSFSRKSSSCSSVSVGSGRADRRARRR